MLYPSAQGERRSTEGPGAAGPWTSGASVSARSLPSSLAASLIMVSGLFMGVSADLALFLILSSVLVSFAKTGLKWFSGASGV